MDQQPKKKLTKIPQSVIDHYQKYENKKLKNKQFLVMGTTFNIDSRYEVIDSVGQGAYGIVVAARDKTATEPESELVAIKKIEKAFEHRIFAKRTLRELKILRLLKHENIIGIKTILLPQTRQDFDDIYVVSELMEIDLAQIIRSPQPLSDEHCQFFLYQILRGLKYIHGANIMHRDLKPRNLLVNSNCDLKICDFGLARAHDEKQKADVMTDYVATRWYRAPELLLSWKDYTTAVDMWSVGCIFAELLKRKPFLPGSDSKNQLELIFDVIGTPTEEEINLIPKEKNRQRIRQLKKRNPKSYEAIFPNASPLAIDLLKRMLTYDPAKRITVQDALDHQYLAALHFPEDEPAGEPVNPLDFEFEEYPLNIEQIKDLIYEEILLYHYKDFKEEYAKKKSKGESLIKYVLKNDNSKLPDLDSDDEDSDDDFN